MSAYLFAMGFTQRERVLLASTCFAKEGPKAPLFEDVRINVSAVRARQQTPSSARTTESERQAEHFRARWLVGCDLGDNSSFPAPALGLTIINSLQSCESFFKAKSKIQRSRCDSSPNQVATPLTGCHLPSWW